MVVLLQDVKQIILCSPEGILFNQETFHAVLDNCYTVRPGMLTRPQPHEAEAEAEATTHEAEAEATTHEAEAEATTHEAEAEAEAKTHLEILIIII